MSKHPRIDDLLSADEPVLSVEFFPPKNEEGARQMLRTACRLRDIRPDFVSITYGAGGTTRKRTLDYADLISEIFDFQVMPHLTCVGHSRDELREILAQFAESGLASVMALRGDPPKGETDFKPHPDGLSYASELVALVREAQPDFCIGVAGYPEKHPEADSLEKDLQHLKHKVDQGAAFITTQLFFDNADYFRFVEQCRELGITVPIVAGLLPVLSASQLDRFCAMCGSSIPPLLKERLEAAGDDAEGQRKAGMQWALDQARELIQAKVPGIHLYILNRPDSALDLSQALVADGLIGAR